MLPPLQTLDTIYADISRFPGEDGAGFFNVLAFRGVFFGSPFAQSDRYQWFDTFTEWKRFRAEGLEVAKQHSKDGDEKTYYVKRNCYGQSQTDRSTKLLSKYWNQRLLWNAKFNKPTKPTITEVYRWLTKRVSENGDKTLFRNIGSLSALLICGDLIEADILSMPTAHEWGGLIYALRMGANDAMEMLGLIRKKASKEEVSKAFASLDLALQQELTEEELGVVGHCIRMAVTSLNSSLYSFKKHNYLNIYKLQSIYNSYTCFATLKI